MSFFLSSFSSSDLLFLPADWGVGAGERDGNNTDEPCGLPDDRLKTGSGVDGVGEIISVATGGTGKVIAITVALPVRDQDGEERMLLGSDTGGEVCIKLVDLTGTCDVVGMTS